MGGIDDPCCIFWLSQKIGLLFQNDEMENGVTATGNLYILREQQCPAIYRNHRSVFSPSATSHVQPCNGGNIACMKQVYKTVF